MRYLIIICCLAFAKASLSQNSPPSAKVLEAFEAQTFEHQGKKLPYRILIPKDFDASKKYPLHLFLHGAGERGNDNISQLIHGAELFLEKNSDYPAIVIFPQCPAEDYWSDVNVERNNNQNVFIFPKDPTPTWAMSAVISLLDSQLENSFIDKNRIYLGGLSMGGMGTFELLNHRPKTFAAATPICGGGYPGNVDIWAQNTPVWIFHGEEDNVVPAFYSKIMIERLLKNSIEPRVSLYRGVYHDSWTNAFAETQFFPWIYSQGKKEQISKSAEEDCTPEWLKFSEESLLGRYEQENNKIINSDDTDLIVFMGDSITEGWTDTSPEFWKNNPNYINRGVSGQTTPQMLIRFRQDVLNLQPKSVVILAGTNDIAGNTGRTSIEAIANNLFTMADLAKQHQIKVILSSVLPVYDYPWKPGLEPSSKIIALNKMIEDFALIEGHIYLDYHTQMKNDKGGMIETLSYDGVHCTKEGYTKMEQLIKPLLN